MRDIAKCLESVYAETKALDFEVIVADNGSSDGSLAYIREHFPKVRLVANGRNLCFGPGNNMGFHLATGDYVLILNPDTIIHERAIEKLVAYADRHPEAGAFGCRTLNQDGSLQGTAQPRPTVFRYLIRALYLRGLARVSSAFDSDQYIGWDGTTEREIGFQGGCTLLVRGPLLRELSGFDPQFLHQFEDADLCHRVWKSGKTVRYCPEAEITHIGGQQRGRYSIRVYLETQRSKYRYFYKHYGASGAQGIRRVTLIEFGLRYIGYTLLGIFGKRALFSDRLGMYRVMLKWTWALNPVQFAESGAEPDVGYEPLARPSAAISARPGDSLKPILPVSL